MDLKKLHTILNDRSIVETEPLKDDGATHMDDIPMLPGHFGGNRKDPHQVKVDSVKFTKGTPKQKVF